jgi:cytochrome-b5 reductase
MAQDTPLSSRKYIDGIYIPAGLIVFGTFMLKREWVPYAVVIALSLGALKFFNLRV